MEETFSVWSVPRIYNEDCQLRVVVVRSEKLLAEAEDSSGNERKYTVVSRYHATTSYDCEDFVCAVATVIFRVCNSVRLS
jgi:hypothetical protein